MIWHADSSQTYSSPPYRVYWGIRFCSAWIFKGTRGNKRIGDAESIKAAMQLCENHALRAPQG